MNKYYNRLTITDFAEMLGTSTATVSRAFSDKGRISSKTRQRILQKAAEMGYRPNIHARNLTARHSDTVALFYPELRGEEPDYFLTEIMLGINRSLVALQRTLQIHPFERNSTADEMNRYVDLLLNGSFAGIIVLGETVGSRTLAEMARHNQIPCVGIGPAPAPESNSVWYNNSSGAFLAGKYFRDTRRERPAYIAGFTDANKERGFRDGYAGEVKIIDGGYSFRHGALAFERLMKEQPDTDCVLCANDILAIGFMKAAIDSGKKIPQDLAVIGFDDIHPARFFNPALSSITLHLYDLGEKSVQILGHLLSGAREVPSESVECDLILRQSS